MLADNPQPAAPSDTSAEPPLCEAPGCGRPLSPGQLVKGARACSPACRAKAHRERRKRARLAEIDAAVATLLSLRAEIEGG